MRPLVAAGAVVLAGCGSSPAAQRDPLLTLPVPTAATVATRAVPGLGTVLVDGSGRTLYMFPPDAQSRVSCTDTCAGTWPPLVLAGGAEPTAGIGVDAALLATVPDPNTGARVVTYHRFPLYRYASDIAAGTALGQGLFNSGGPWYVLSAAGEPITTTPAGR